MDAELRFVLSLLDENERLKKELARIQSCICHRIPGKDWHLKKCPAK